MKYPTGTVIQHRTQYIFTKTDTGKWVSNARLVMMKDIGRPLQENERVFHKNGNRSDNGIPNLVIITINLTKYKLLPMRRVLYLPKEYTKGKPKMGYPVSYVGVAA
jgi:hypothetical protein